MGGTGDSGMASFSAAAYKDLYAERTKAKGVASFTHEEDMRTGRVARGTHERLDPKKIKDSVTGKREARDGNETPNSNPVAVFCDVTGSMRSVPRVIQEKLGKLMGVIKSKSVLDDPQILLGAVGDSRSDRSPLQVGQFEATLAADEDLDKFHLEGNGGMFGQESYELVLYFLARLTSTDSYEKRGKRGYAFIIGDEMSYDVSRAQLRKVFGTDFGEQEDIPLEKIIEEAKEKWEIFFILPTPTCGGQRYRSYWQKYFEQNVLPLDDPDLINETIATAIGVAEGVIDGADELASDLGMSSKETEVVTRALTAYTKTKSSLAVVEGGDLIVSDEEDGLD